MKIIPLDTHRSSTRGLPWDFGKKGSRRAICASVSQKRSDMVTDRFRAVNHATKRKSIGSGHRQQAADPDDRRHQVFCWPTEAMMLTEFENPWKNAMSCPSSPCANHEKSALQSTSHCIVFEILSNGASTSSRTPAALPPVTIKLRRAS